MRKGLGFDFWCFVVTCALIYCVAFTIEMLFGPFPASIWP